MAKKAKAATPAKDKNEPATLPKVQRVRVVSENRLQVSADLLSIAPENMRHEHKFDPALAASIKAHGLINPLVCRTVVPALPELPCDSYLVVDGGRRLTAIKGAIVDGELPADFMVDIFTNEQAGKEISLAANQYLEAHPLDKCEAILELAKTEDDELRLAAAFGMRVKSVKQYAALAGLSDKAKQAYRDARCGLETAILMTRLTPAQQDKLCKGKGRIYEHEVRQVIDGIGVESSVAEFDWKTLYPPEKIQRSLFEDIVMLLDRDKFKELQETFYKEKIEGLEKEGFNILRLKHGDYMTRGKYVEYSGRVTESMKPSLTILVNEDYSGLKMSFSGPMMLAKDAKKLKKVKGSADKTSEPPKALTAKDLTPAQNAILNGHIAADLRMRVAKGEVSDAMVQWLVIASATNVPCQWVEGRAATKYGGSDSQWERWKKDYPGEFDTIMPGDDRAGLATMEWETFRKKPPKDRERLFLMAVAALVMPPANIDQLYTKVAAGAGVKRVVPGEAFFKRWRTDQLLDYLKRTPGAIQPADSKKSSAVAAAVVAASLPGAWQFNIPDKEGK